MLPKQRVAWYLLNRWRPLTTFRETNHVRWLLRDKYRPSLWPWNASLSRTTIWKSSCAKGMRDTAPRKKTKKVPVPSDETKKDRKVATPQADRSDKL